MTTQLTKETEALLEQLVQDYNSQCPPEERLFNPDHSAGYIYNLFINHGGKFKYSIKQYRELFNYLCDKRAEADQHPT